MTNEKDRKYDVNERILGALSEVLRRCTLRIALYYCSLEQAKINIKNLLIQKI